MADKYITYPQPRVGQVYGHCDPRRRGKFFVIKSIGLVYAGCKYLGTGTSRSIALNRLNPAHNGYFLAWDPEIAGEVINQVFGTVVASPPTRKGRCPIQVPAVLEPLVHIPVAAAV